MLSYRPADPQVIFLGTDTEEERSDHVFVQVKNTEEGRVAMNLWGSVVIKFAHGTTDEVIYREMCRILSVVDTDLLI